MGLARAASLAACALIASGAHVHRSKRSNANGPIYSLDAAAQPHKASTARTKRYLPDGPLNMGYAPNCVPDKIINATKTGLNVLFWFSVNLIRDPATGAPAVQGGPDLDCVANVTGALRAMGLKTTHMLTVGGWDGERWLLLFAKESWCGVAHYCDTAGPTWNTYIDDVCNQCFSSPLGSCWGCKLYCRGLTKQHR